MSKHDSLILGGGGEAHLVEDGDEVAGAMMPPALTDTRGGPCRIVAGGNLLDEHLGQQSVGTRSLVVDEGEDGVGSAPSGPVLAGGLHSPLLDETIEVESRCRGVNPQVSCHVGAGGRTAMLLQGVRDLVDPLLGSRVYQAGVTHAVTFSHAVT